MRRWDALQTETETETEQVQHKEQRTDTGAEDSQRCWAQHSWR